MHAFWASLINAGRHRRRPETPRSGPGLGRLLLGEVAWAARQAIHPTKMAAAALVAVGVGVLLGPTTPGPVLGAGWRLALATVLGLTALAVSHALLQRRRNDAADALSGLRVVVAAVALLVAGTMVLTYLLAVITGSAQGDGNVALVASLPIDTPLLVGAVLLGAGVLAAGLGHRLAMPSQLLFLGLGMAIGSDGLGWLVVSDAQMVQTLSVAALVVILFDGGVTTDAHRLRLGIGPGLALATIGVAITAGVTALGTMWLLDVPPRVAWLIGAIVSSTDAAAVFSLLRRAPLPERLAAILQIESGANDPIAVLLTVGLLAAWDAPPTATAWLGFGALQMIGGVAVGAAVGWLGAMVLRRARLGAEGLYPVMAIAIAGTAYGAAAAVGASGFLAVYLTGIVVAAEAPRRRRVVRSFVAALAGAAEVGLFLLLGLLVDPAGLPAVAVTALGVAALLVLVARPLASMLTLTWFNMPLADIATVSWLGMRGAVPIVLATLALSAGIVEAPLIFDVVFFVVLTSTVVQGATAVPFIRRLGVAVPLAPGRTVAEALPLDDVDVDIVEVTLDSSSPLVGRALDASHPPDDVLVVAVVRGDRVVLARGQTRFLTGDRLVITTTDCDDGLGRVQDWTGPAVTPGG